MGRLLHTKEGHADPLIMDWRSTRNRWWMRAVASVLVLAFVYQDIAWAAPADTVAPVEKRFPAGNDLSRPSNVNGSISIPRTIAVTKDVFTAAGDRTIINIQDAHAYLGAQESIASVLDTLVRDYDLKVVAVEGSSGYIDTSLLRTFPDEKARNAAAKRLMAEGRMSAGEFFAVTSKKEVALYGIEDEPLYRQNVDEFRKLYDLNGALARDVSQLSAALANAAEKTFAPELLELDKQMALYRDGKVSFAWAWETVSRAASSAGIDPAGYRNLSLFVSLIAAEKKIDFAAANKERDALITAVSKTLAKDELAAFARDLLAFKGGELSNGAFYAALARLAAGRGFGLDAYPQLSAYISYITLYETIDLAEIAAEMAAVTAAVKEKLYRTDDERVLARCIRFADGMRNLFSMEIDSAEFEAFERDYSSLTPETFRASLMQCSRRAGIRPASCDAGKLFAAIPDAAAFYRTAERRNAVMLENTVRRMSAEGANVAALITGGYHTRGLTGLLRAKQCSYVVVLPRFDASKGERPYITILTNKKKTYAPLVASGKYYLATAAYFQHDSGRTEDERFEAYADDFSRTLYDAVSAVEGDEAREAEMDRLVGIWAENYRAFYRGFQAAQEARRAAGQEPIDFTPRDPKQVAITLRSLVHYSKSTRPLMEHLERARKNLPQVRGGEGLAEIAARQERDIAARLRNNGFIEERVFQAAASIAAAAVGAALMLKVFVMYGSPLPVIVFGTAFAGITVGVMQYLLWEYAILGRAPPSATPQGAAAGRLDAFLARHAGGRTSVVTGAAGFIGARLVGELLADGEAVIAVVRSADAGRLARLSGFAADGRLHILTISDSIEPPELGLLRRAIAASATVYHAAGRADPATDTFEKAVDSIASNALLTAVVAKLCADGRAKIVYLSTARIFLGTGEAGGAVSEATPLPVSQRSARFLEESVPAFRQYAAERLGGRTSLTPREFVASWLERSGITTARGAEESFTEGIYAVSKVLGERFVDELPAGTGVTVRMSTVYGPSPRQGDIVSIVTGRLFKGLGVMASTDTRNFVYIDDVVRAIVTAGTKRFPRNETFFLASPGRATTFLDLVSMIVHRFPRPARTVPQIIPGGPLGTQQAFDIAKAARELSFAPRPLDAGIAETVWQTILARRLADVARAEILPPEHPERLAARYDEIERGLADHGIDVGMFFDDAAAFGRTEAGEPVPWQTANPFIAAYPLDGYEGGEELVTSLAAVQDEIEHLAGAGYATWLRPEDLHSTIFEIRRTMAPGPNEELADPAVRERYSRELDEAVRGIRPYRLVFDRILIADNGTVIAAGYVDSGELTALREDLRGRFPGDEARRTQAVHISLGRFWKKPSPEALEALKRYVAAHRAADLGTITVDHCAYAHFGGPITDPRVERVHTAWFGIPGGADAVDPANETAVADALARLPAGERSRLIDALGRAAPPYAWKFLGELSGREGSYLVHAAINRAFASIMAAQFGRLTQFSASKVQGIRSMFEQGPGGELMARDGAYHTRPVPGTDTVLTGVFSPATQAYLERVTGDLVAALGSGVPVYRVMPQTYHVSVALLQESATSDADALRLTGEERAALMDLMRRLARKYGPVSLRLAGIRIGEDGGIIAVWEDDGALELLRQEFFREGLGITQKIKGARPKPFLYTTLGRILDEPLPGAFDALKARAAGYADLRPSGITEEIAGLRAVHETRWMCEAYEDLEAMPLAGAEGRAAPVAQRAAAGGFFGLTPQERYDLIRAAGSEPGADPSFSRRALPHLMKVIDALIAQGSLPRLSGLGYLPGSPRILLIAPYYKKDELKIGSFLAPPMGIYRIASFLKVFGIRVDVFDPNLQDPQDLVTLVRLNRYAFIGCSTYDPTVKHDIELARALKEASPRSIFIAGGEGAASNRDRLLAPDAPFDMVYRGFGEYPLLDTAILFMQEQSLPLGDPAKMDRIAGVIYRAPDGAARETPRGPPLTQGDYRAISLLFDSATVPYERYWGYMEGLSAAASLPVDPDALHTVRIITSSHCPMGCTFCSFSGFLDDATAAPRQPVLFLDPQEVVLQLQRIGADHPAVKTVFFNDENFLRDRRRVMELCDLIAREFEPGRFRFIALGRADHVDRATLAAMARAGFVQLNYGIESFSDAVLIDMNKHLRSADAAVKIRETLDAGILPLINLILFYPTATMADVRVTVDRSLDFVEQGAGLAYWPFVESFHGAPIMEKVASGEYRLSEDGDFILPADAETARIALDAVRSKNAVADEIRARYGVTGRLPHVVDVLAFFIAVYRAAGIDTARIDLTVDSIMKRSDAGATLPYETTAFYGEYVREHPGVSAATAQHAVVEYLRKRPDLLAETLAAVTPSNRHLFGATGETVAILRDIQAGIERGVAAVLRPGASVLVSVQADIDDGSGSQVPMNGRIRHVFDGEHRNGIITLDGEPFGAYIPYEPIDSHVRRLSARLAGRDYLVVPDTNLYTNDHVVVFADGVIYHAAGEFDRPVQRLYTSLVVWKDGHNSIETLRYLKGAGDAKDTVFRVGADGAPDEDITASVTAAVYGQQLVTGERAKTEAEIRSTMRDEFPDPGHLAKPYPHTMIGIGKDGELIVLATSGDRLRGEGLMPWEMAELMRRHGAVDAINIADGGDTSLRRGDALITASPSGRVGTATSSVRTATPVVIALASPAGSPITVETFSANDVRAAAAAAPDACEAVRALTERSRVAMVMPMFREARRLQPRDPAANPLGEDALRKKVASLEALRATNPLFEWRLIAVDDGSDEEGSSATAVETLWGEIRAEYRARGIELGEDLVTTVRIRPVDKTGKKGGAVQMGMAHALGDGWADYIGYTDVDTSISMDTVARLIAPLARGEADVAIGSRWCDGAAIKELALSGRISSRGYNYLVRSVLFPLRHITDTQRGFKVFRRRVIEDTLLVTRDRSLSFDTELLLLAALRGHVIREVPITWVDSAEARTFNGAVESVRMAWHVLGQTRQILAHYAGVFRAQTAFAARFAAVLAVTCGVVAAVAGLYASGALSWYLDIKGAIPAGALIYLPAAIADMVTGVLIWGVSDANGQYLNKGSGVRVKQSLIVGSFGIFQGLATHILFNALNLLPVLPFAAMQMVLRTCVALGGGFVISLVFARATSFARRALGVEEYAEKQEWMKAGDVVLAKTMCAPLKTFVVVNLLPPSIRVVSEQVWDYAMTIFAAYLMNRSVPLFTKRLARYLPTGRGTGAERLPFQVELDPQKAGDRYRHSGCLVSIGGADHFFTADSVDVVIDLIRQDRGTRMVPVSVAASTPGEQVSFTMEVDNALAALLEHGAHRIDLQALIQEAIKIRGPDMFRQLAGRTITLALIDQSRSLFEDHTRNNFIAVNRILFDSVAPRMSSRACAALLATALTHELRHEAGETSEGDITREDVKYIHAVLGAGETYEVADLPTVRTALEDIASFERSFFLRGLKNVLDRIAANQGPSAPGDGLPEQEPPAAARFDAARAKAHLAAISKNLAVIEDPALKDFRDALGEATRPDNDLTVNAFLAFMNRYNSYMAGARRQKEATAALGLAKDERIAYFSLEYGLSQWLNIYGGGLGILSGDTLWAASDRYAKNTFVAVGLAYHTGYLEQHIVTEEDLRDPVFVSRYGSDLPVGTQVEYYEEIPFEKYGDIVTDAGGNDIVVRVETVPGKAIYAKIWRIRVGRVELYLLDTDIAENDQAVHSDAEPNARKLTYNLYPRGRFTPKDLIPRQRDEWRFKQELLLGIGGVRALQAMGQKIAVLHMNEGHSALSSIELIRQELERRASDQFGFDLKTLNRHVRDREIDPKLLVEAGVTFRDACDAVGARMGFTSHTPIPDGNEEYDIDIFEKYFRYYADLHGMNIENIKGISTSLSPVFGDNMVNLSTLALKLARYSNGVSEKHGEVSRDLYRDDRIGSITNSVHRRFWQSDQLQALLESRLADAKRAGAAAGDTELGDLNRRDIEALIGDIDDATIAAALKASRDEAIDDLERTRGIALDKDAFIIVIARRAAPYKRSDIIIPKIDELLRKADELGVKVQIVFAGKAHRDDERGKGIITRINQAIKQYPGTAFFVENYNIPVARDLTRLANVWLNTPIRPLEASGTSGMKAAMNGCLSVSTGDGWVLEAKGAVEALDLGDPLKASGAAVLFRDVDGRDDETRENMYNVLVPLMDEFARDKGAWTRRSKGVIADAMAFFAMERFIKEYEEKMYKPSLDQARLLAMTAGVPRRITKADFVRGYGRTNRYQDGAIAVERFTLENELTPLLREACALLPASAGERLGRLVRRFIPALRPAPVGIEVVRDLGTNAVKYIDEATGEVSIVLDELFVETLLANRNRYPGVSAYLLAERLAHELAHIDSIPPGLSDAEWLRMAMEDEVRVIRDVDLPLYRRTLRNAPLKQMIDKFFDEVKPKFPSGHYFDKGLLAKIAAMSPAAAEAEIRTHVRDHYMPLREVQRGVMRMPTRSFWHKGEAEQNEYEQTLTNQRRDVLSRSLPDLEGVPRQFIANFIEHMPNEHVRRASVDRLVQEIASACLMFRHYAQDAADARYKFFLYNPPDVNHTELMIFGRHTPDLLSGVASILKDASGGDLSIQVFSDWGYTPRENDTGIFVFEMRNARDPKKPVALTKDGIARVVASCAELFPGRTEHVDALALCDQDSALKEGAAKIAATVKAAVPEEVPIPSVKGDEILFLTVRRAAALTSYDKVIREVIWTPRDTPRQRAAKVYEEQSRMRSAVETALRAILLEQVSWRTVTHLADEAIAALVRDGLNPLPVFDRGMSRYVKDLRESGQEAWADRVKSVLDRVIEEVGLHDRIADTDQAVEEEIAKLQAVVSSVRASIELLKAKTEDAKAEEAAAIAMQFVDMELHNVIDFVRREHKKAYVKVLEMVNKYGPTAMAFSEAIAKIRARGLDPEAEESAIKPYEAIIDGYVIWMETLRRLHNYAYNLPADEAIVRLEREHAEQALEKVSEALEPATRAAAAEFLQILGRRLRHKIAPGGHTASQIAHEIAIRYSLRHQDKAQSVMAAVGLFMTILEKESIIEIPQDEQRGVLYITEIMDQMHAFNFLEENPFIASIGTQVGNSRSHWVIATENMVIDGRELPVTVIPGVKDLKSLQDGDVVIVDCQRQALILNPLRNNFVMTHYLMKAAERAVLHDIYRAHRMESAVTVDGRKMTFLSDVTRILPDATLTGKFGAAGVGLNRMENLYMRRKEPTEDEICAAALTAADAIAGPLTFRTLDMADDKAKAMASIKDAIEWTTKTIRGKTVDVPRYTGVTFYLKDPKGQAVFRTQLRALMRAYAGSAEKNIRVTIPMVNNRVQARYLARIANEVKDELVREGAVPAGALDDMQFGAMIETVKACNAVTSILNLGFFSYISIGTNDLARDSANEQDQTKLERDDVDLEKGYHNLSGNFMRHIEMALGQVDELNARPGREGRPVKVCFCGEWTKSRKFNFYLLGLMYKYAHIEIDSVTSSYKIGELKEYVRNVSLRECADALQQLDHVNEKLDGRVKAVDQRIDEKYGVKEKAPGRLETVMKGASAFFASGAEAPDRQPILRSSLLAMARVDLLAAILVSAIILLSRHAGVAAGLSLPLAFAAGYAAAHAVTAYFIRKAFAVRGIPLRDEQGRERPIAYYSVKDNLIRYLYVNELDPSDVTYDPSEQPARYVRLIDTAAGNPLLARFARRFIKMHERTHMVGWGEFMAYYFPFVGSFVAARQEQMRYVRKVLAYLEDERKRSISNKDLIAMAEDNRSALFMLADKLSGYAVTTDDIMLKARAYTLIGEIYSQLKYFGSAKSIKEYYEDLALGIIREATKRSVKPPAAALRMPDEFTQSPAKELVVSSPIRVDLTHGGASDLYPMTYESGGAAINIAFDLDGRPPVTVKVRRLAEPVIRIISDDLHTEQTITTKEELLRYTRRDDHLRLYKAAFIVTGIVDPDDTRTLAETLTALGGGIELEGYSSAPEGSGLGGSSVVEACSLEALYRISGQTKTKDEVVDAVLYLEQILGVGGGWQDPIGGIFGGVKYIHSDRGVPQPKVDELKVSDAFIRELESRTVLYYTGPHFAGDILRGIVLDFITRQKVEERQKLVAMDAKMLDALRAENVDRVGEVMSEFWDWWKALNPKASNEDIRDLFDNVSDLVSGGKLLGAGGGGFAFFIAKKGKKEELEERLRVYNDRMPHACLYTGTVNKKGICARMRPSPPEKKRPQSRREAPTGGTFGGGLAEGAAAFIPASMTMLSANHRVILDAAAMSGMLHDVMVFAAVVVGVCCAWWLAARLVARKTRPARHEPAGGEETNVCIAVPAGAGGFTAEAVSDLADSMRAAFPGQPFSIAGVASCDPESAAIADAGRRAGAGRILIVDLPYTEAVAAIRTFLTGMEEKRFRRKYPGITVMNKDTFVDPAETSLRKAVDAIAGSLAPVSPASLEALHAAAAERTAKLAACVAHHQGAGLAEFVAARKAVSITTQGVLDSQMLYALRDKIADRRKALGITNAKDDRIKELVVITDRTMTREKAGRLVDAHGLAPYVDLVMASELPAVIARLRTDGYATFGIRSRQGEVSDRDYAAYFGTGDEAIKLELESIDGAFLDTNSYEVLLELFAKGAADWKGIPGLSKNEERKVFRYLPRALPYNYEAEIAAHRKAIELLLSSA